MLSFLCRRPTCDAYSSRYSDFGLTQVAMQEIENSSFFPSSAVQYVIRLTEYLSEVLLSLNETRTSYLSNTISGENH